MDSSENKYPGPDHAGSSGYRMKSLSHTAIRLSDQGLVVAFPDLSTHKMLEEGSTLKSGSQTETYLTVHFPPAQYAIIKCLIQHLGQVVSYGQLIAAFAPAHIPFSQAYRVLPSHICRLKKKLPAHVMLSCETGKGYRLLLLSEPPLSSSAPFC